MELLGLMVQNTLSFDKHVDIITLVKNNHDERKLDTGVGEGRIQGPSFFIGTFILVVAARTNNSLQKFWVNDEALTDELEEDGDKATTNLKETTRKDDKKTEDIVKESRKKTKVNEIKIFIEIIKNNIQKWIIISPQNNLK